MANIYEPKHYKSRTREWLVGELIALRAERDRLQKFNRALAERCAAQSELLTRAAARTQPQKD